MAGRVPFGEVGPVTFLLGLVEVGIKVDYELVQEVLAQLARLQFFRVVASFELPVLLLPDVPPYLCRHVDI